MARGKPGKEQLDMVSDIFHLMQNPEDYVSDGIEIRNYGEMSGLPAAKRLFAEILGCRPEHRLQGLHPWPAPQPPALVQGGEDQVALPRPRL